MSTTWHRLRQRFDTALAFARAGDRWEDRAALALAGLSRLRPFGDNSLYSRAGRLFGDEVRPRVRDAAGLRIPLDLRDSAETTIFEEIFVEQVYPLEEVTFSPDLVLDCGAFTGMFSLRARQRFPHAAVVAFEPDPHNASRVRHAFAENSSEIELHEAAVGCVDGQARFSGNGYGGKVVPDHADGRAVELVSLPRILHERRPRRLVLKMDIEGAERALLPAVLPLLPADTVIFLETHDEETVVQEYLRAFRAQGFSERVVRRRPEEPLFVERVLVRRSGVVRHFCTYFDKNYASLGLALHASLRRHCPEFKLWVLCLDDAAFELVARWAQPDLIPIRLAELEAADPELLAVKPQRSRIEYIFTCTPCLPLHLLNRDPSIALITYLDADLWFTASPELLFDEIGPRSVTIVPHQFSPGLEHLEENGRFNVGWITFRRDEDGLSCLKDWRARCLDWCYLRHEPGRYADQKYLDDWPQRFRGVCVLGHRGANLGLWNIRGQNVVHHGDLITVGGQPLVFFHFHGLRRPRLWVFCLNSPFYGVRLSPALRRLVLQPYAQEVVAHEARHRIHPDAGTRLEPEAAAGTPWLERVRFIPHLIFHTLLGNYVIARPPRES
jgi:FkbM family methyltransferase